MKKALFASVIAGLILAASPASAEKLFRVAALVAEDQFAPAYDGFRSKMTEFGYVDKNNIRYAFYNARGDVNELGRLAQHIVEGKPDLIVTSSTTATVAVAKLTARTNLPVVFLSAGNPLRLVKSYYSSGNNLTGISSSIIELTEKRLALFRDLAPSIKRVIFITNPKSANYDEYLVSTRDMAKRLGFSLNEIEMQAANGDDSRKQVDRITRRSGDGLFVPPDAALVASTEYIAEQAAREKLPTVGPNVQTVRRGLLTAYSSDYFSLGQQGAKLVDKILHGAKPADLPIELPYKLQLFVNLRAARAIGLNVSREIRLRADELIE